MLSIKHFFKDSLIYTAANWASKIVGFVLIPLYTRLFTPDDYGRLELIVTSTFFLSTVLECGLKFSIIRFFNDLTDEYERQRYSATVFWFKVGISIVFLGGLLLYSDVLSIWLFGTPNERPLMIWAIISVLTTGVWSHTLLLYRLRFQSMAYSVFSLLYLAATLFLTIYFVVIVQVGIIGIYQAKVLTDLLLGGVLIWNNRRFLGKPDLLYLAPLLRFGFPLIFSELAYFVLDYLDRFFIQIYCGAALLGAYAIAYKFSTILTLLSSGFEYAWAPFLYSVHTQHNGKQIVRNIFKGFALLNALFAFAIAMFSQEILTLFTTPAYYGASHVMYIILFALVVYGTAGRFCVGIGIRQKTHYQAWAALGAICMNAFLNWLLIPTFGIAGAAWATLLSHWAYGAYLMRISQKLYYVDLGLKRFVLMLLVFLGCCRLISGIEHLSVSIFLLKVVVFIVVGTGTPLFFRFITVADVKTWYSEIRRSLEKLRLRAQHS